MVQPDAFGEVVVEVGNFARNIAVHQRRLQQPQAEIRPAEVGKRHVDEEDVVHGVGTIGVGEVPELVWRLTVFHIVPAVDKDVSDSQLRRRRYMVKS